jgi:hypothetical protein
MSHFFKKEVNQKEKPMIPRVYYEKKRLALTPDRRADWPGSVHRLRCDA